MPAEARPKLAVYKFSSCDGCQLALLSLEDELMSLAGAVEIAYFLEASSATAPGPYDVALVEGSVTTPEDVERLRSVREQSKFLVTIGACATTGGIQALRNWADVNEYARAVYATPAYLSTLEQSTPISTHVAVDFEINGCPINKYQVLEVLTALLLGQTPHLPRHSVCLECKRRGTPCVMVSQGIPCLGPVTQTGCGALCPAYGRGCYGCFGPMESPNMDSFSAYLVQQGTPSAEVVRMFRGFTGYAEAFRSAGNKLGKSSQ